MTRSITVTHPAGKTTHEADHFTLGKDGTLRLYLGKVLVAKYERGWLSVNQRSIAVTQKATN